MLPICHIPSQIVYPGLVEVQGVWTRSVHLLDPTYYQIKGPHLSPYLGSIHLGALLVPLIKVTSMTLECEC